MADILLDHFKLAGGQYYDLKKIIEDIKENDLLDLVDDPENPHDEHAVQVYWCSDHTDYLVGYLSRTKNTIIHNLLINNLSLYGVVTSGDPQNSTQLEFDVYLTR